MSNKQELIQFNIHGGIELQGRLVEILIVREGYDWYSIRLRANYENKIADSMSYSEILNVIKHGFLVPKEDMDVLEYRLAMLRNDIEGMVLDMIVFTRESHVWN